MATKSDSADLSTHELALANQKIRRLERENRGLRSVRTPTPTQPSPENGLQSPTEPEGTQESASKPHFVGAWQQYCPDCGDKNPDFKDETKCKKCGMHLGGKESAPKLKACPNCGGVDAEMIKS